MAKLASKSTPCEPLQSLSDTLSIQRRDELVRIVRGVCPIEPALVTEPDEMIAVERLDVGGHGFHPVGDRRGRACSRRGTTR